MNSISILLTIVISILTLHLGTTLAVQCLTCTSVPRVQDCPYIMECGPHSVCYASTFVTSGGQITYKLGCRDSLRCTSSQSVVGKRGSDVLVCDQCCNSTLCQYSLCGNTAESARGPICYSCSEQLSQSSCDLIKTCGRDEVCFESTGRSPSGSLVRKTGCQLKHVCDSIQNSYLLSGTNDTCFNCCPTDLCNANCTTAMHTTADKTKVTTTAGQSCVDSTSEQTCQLASSIVCGDPAHARNAGCSHYCGFC